MIDPPQQELASFKEKIDQENLESFTLPTTSIDSHYQFIQRSSDWIELIHNKPNNNMPNKNHFHNETSNNSHTPLSTNDGSTDSPNAPLEIYLTSHRNIHEKKDHPFIPSFLNTNDNGYESDSSSNDNSFTPGTCDEVTPAITTPVHFLTEQHDPFSPTTINKSSSTKEFPVIYQQQNPNIKK